MTIHDPLDCDGFMTVHRARVVVTTHAGATTRTSQARCDDCDWSGSRCGPAAVGLAEREAREHTREVACDGRCRR